MSVAPEQGPRPQPIKSAFALLSFGAAIATGFFAAQPQFIISAEKTVSVPWFNDEQIVLAQRELSTIAALLTIALAFLAWRLKPKGS